MKKRLIRGIAALSIVAGLGVGLGVTAGASGFGFGNVPHGHSLCASDAWNIHNCD
jgi:hypothetical protein